MRAGDGLRLVADDGNLNLICELPMIGRPDWNISRKLKKKIKWARLELKKSHRPSSGSRKIQATPLDGMAEDNDSATASSAVASKRLKRSHALVDDPKQTKQLAAMFATMVTVPASENDWIARNGDESLFKVLEKMLPEVRSIQSPQYIKASACSMSISCHVWIKGKLIPTN